MISWILHYWVIIALSIGVMTGGALLRFYFGSRYTWPALAACVAFIIFILGKKIERDNYSKSVQDIKDKREKAYEKIDDRDTDASDAADRLSDGSF